MIKVATKAEILQELENKFMQKHLLDFEKQEVKDDNKGKYYNDYWKITLFYGRHSKYDDKVYAVKAESRLGEHS